MGYILDGPLASNLHGGENRLANGSSVFSIEIDLLWAFLGLFLRIIVLEIFGAWGGAHLYSVAPWLYELGLNLPYRTMALFGLLLRSVWLMDVISMATHRTRWPKAQERGEIFRGWGVRH